MRTNGVSPVKSPAPSAHGGGTNLAHPFVGREHERDVLLRTVVAPPALVMVEGEAGIGKSRLVEELGPIPPAARLLVGRGHRLREPFPFGPMLEALRGVAQDPPSYLGPVTGTLRGLLPELAASLPASPGALTDPRAERHLCFRALLDLLSALGPTVVVLEDLQWSDEATLELLEFVVGQHPAELSLVLTYRREGLAPSSPLIGLSARALAFVQCRQLVLGPLRPCDTRPLIEGLLGGEPVSIELADLVHTRTAGNPFAIVQVIGLLVDRGHLAWRHGCWTADEAAARAVPPALRDSVLQRTALLGRDARNALDALAVLECAASPKLIVAVSEMTAVRATDALCIGLAAGIVRESPAGGFAFCNSLAADAVRQAIPTCRCTELHHRAARALARSPEPRPLARIAYHCRQAGLRARWVRYAELAADALVAAGADREAAILLGDAVSTPGLPLRARARIAIKLGDAALYGRAPLAAIPLLEQILDDDSAPRVLRGEVRLALAWLLEVTGDHRASVEMGQATRELDGSRRSPRAMSDLAARIVTVADGDDPQRLIERAAEAAGNSKDHALLVRIAAARAEVLLARGDPAALAAVERVPWETAGAGEHELVRAAKRLSGLTLALGHHDRAQVLLARAERARERLGSERFRVGIATTRNVLLWRIGAWEGLPESAPALAAESAELPGMWAVNQLVASRLALARGDLAGAERGFADILGRMQATESPLGVIAAAGALAAVHLARRRHGPACGAASLGVEALRRHGLWVRAYNVVPVAVDALLACDRTAEASALTRELAGRLRGLDAPAALAALACCRAALAEAEGRGERAVRGFSRAERAWRRLPWPYEAARARERAGRAALARGDEAGIGRLLGACEEYRSLGATWDEGRVRAALRDHNVRVPVHPPGGRKGYGERLSPREEQVARLAAMGKSNREIGEALVISRHTAAHHVAAVLRKLAVTSRKDLASLALGRRTINS